MGAALKGVCGEEAGACGLAGAAAAAGVVSLSSPAARDRERAAARNGSNQPRPTEHTDNGPGTSLARRIALLPGGPMATRFLAQQPLVLAVGSTVFAHGGQGLTLVHFSAQPEPFWSHLPMFPCP
jgi:hypothetical protein